MMKDALAAFGLEPKAQLYPKSQANLSIHVRSAMD
jgi:hypothetical protein